MPRWKWFLSAKHNSACLPNVPVRFRTESGPSQVVFTLGSKNGRTEAASFWDESQPSSGAHLSARWSFLDVDQCGGFNKKMKES